MCAEARGVELAADVLVDAFERAKHAEPLLRARKLLERLEVDAADDVWRSIGPLNRRCTADYEKRRSQALERLKKDINDHWNARRAAAADRLTRRGAIALEGWLPDAVARERARKEAAEREIERQAELRREEAKRAAAAERRRDLARDYWNAGLLWVSAAALTTDDVELANSWGGGPEARLRNLSARAAERAAQEFFVRRGYTVEDVAILQLRRPEDLRWKFADIAVNDDLVDVKNSRESEGSPLTYTEHCVRFKKHRGAPVVVLGTFSQFVDEQSVLDGSQSLVRVLGVTSRPRVELITKFFTSDRFKPSFGGDFYPPWIFEVPDSWYRRREQVHREITRAFEVDSVIDAFITLPADLDGEARELIRNAIDTCGCSLPVLFLLCLSLKLLHGDSSYQLFRQACQRPDLDLFKLVPDPLAVLDSLHEILGDISSSDLTKFVRFHLSARQILRGFDGESWSTIYAYCGGHLEDGSRCGMFPLTMTRHRTCERCGYLVCSRCASCNSSCDSHRC